jgi:lysophospholipase L1-like esterase
MKPTRMIVLGDSVPWGQGLATPHKYATVAGLGLGLPTPPEMYARSGAIIDPGGGYGTSSSPCAASSSEIPLPAPTVRAQLSLVDDPNSVDLVLVNGGLNDVDFRRILNPLTSSDQLTRWIRAACYVGIKTLIGEVARTFTNPNARCLLTGYYPILSTKSDQSSIQVLLSVFGIALPGHLPKDPLLLRVTQLCLQFWRESDTAFAAAVRDANAEPVLAGRWYYVPGPYTEDNALFAPTPLLFGLDAGLNPEDEVAGSRWVACRQCYTDPLDLMQLEQCRLASVGHPTIAGAAAYAAAIVAMLQ